MSDMNLIREKLEQVREALLRIEKRSSSIQSPGDFLDSEDNMEKLDAIAMMLIAVGESFRKIDRETDGKLLAKYPDIDWRGVIGLRNVLAHDYFDIDAEEIFKICKHDAPRLLNSVKQMLERI
jgi:uncharacterized protein with HEPN domain